MMRRGLFFSVLLIVSSTLGLNLFSQQEMFDDFVYKNVNDSEFKNFGWIVRSGSGGPGPAGCSWSQNNVSFVNEGGGNKSMRLMAKTKGTGLTTVQSEVYTSRQFLEGTYAARIRFTDSPFSGGPDDDQINQTFFTISPLVSNLDPNYSEVDFVEYLANGGWGTLGPNFWMTTWETYQAEPWIQDSKSDVVAQSYAGWHVVACVIANGQVKYYIDGELKATHEGKYYPESIMSINFNHWFIGAGLKKSTSERVYVEDIDWVYHAKDTVIEPLKVVARISEFRAYNIISKKLNGTIREGQMKNISLSCKLTTPGNNSMYKNDSNIIIEAEVIDSVSDVVKVIFYNGDQNLFSDLESPYAYTIEGASAGFYNISAVAINSVGDTITSDVVFVTVEEEQLPVDKPSVILKKTPTPIVLDGVIDPIWGGINAVNIENNVTSAPSIDNAYWKACWNENGIFVLVEVTDNSFWPSELSGKESWQSDKPEVYFDVNSKLIDGIGASAGISSGHYQLAPTFVIDEDGNEQSGIGNDEGCKYAHKVTGSNYVFEYFIPFTLFNKAPAFSASRPIGFDITVIDLDEGAAAENRITWANKEDVASSWGNMDGCGIVTLSNETLTVSVNSITKKNPVVAISGNRLLMRGITENACLYDITGKKVLTIAKGAVSVNIQQLKKGVYIFKSTQLVAKVVK